MGVPGEKNVFEQQEVDFSFFLFLQPITEF